MVTGGSEGAASNRNAPRHSSAISLAVRPYTCVRDGQVDADFAERMTFFINNALCQFADLKVISAHSMLAASRLDWSISDLGLQFSVRYVLRGEITIKGPELVFRHVIHDAVTGMQWPLFPVEIPLDNLHDIESSVVPRIVVGVLPHLNELDLEKSLNQKAGGLAARDFHLRAMMALHRLTPASLCKAELFLTEAQRLDPKFATAFAWHARIHSLRIGQDWSSDRDRTIAEAVRLADIAMGLDADNAVALAIAGHMRSYLHCAYEEGLALLERAIAACPNEPSAWFMSSMTLSYMGRADEAREHAEYGLSLSPMDRLAFWFLSYAANSAYAQGDYDAAVSYARKSYAENKDYTANYRTLACALVGQNRLEEARACGAILRRLQPNFAADAEHIIRFQDPIVRARCFAHLRIAGLLDAVAA